MDKLNFPRVKGGKVTNATFNEGGNIVELWVTLDTGESSIECMEKFDVVIGCRIHLNTVTDTVAK